MKFTRNNYEEHALDYLEGTMNVQEQAEFQRFLTQHQDLAEEIEAFELLTVSPGSEIFQHKERLYRKTGWSGTLIGICAGVVLIAMAIFFWISPRDAMPLETVVQETEHQKSIAAPLERSPSLTPNTESVNTRKSDTDPASLVEQQPTDFKPTAVLKSVTKSQLQESNVNNREESNEVRLVQSIDPVNQSQMEQDIPKLAPDLQKVDHIRPLEIRSTELQLPRRQLGIEVIHPALIDQLLQKLDAEEPTKKRWLAQSGLIPSAFAGASRGDIKNKLLPSYMVAE